MPDAVVIGAGPNGLVAACTLARRGWSVVVVEAQAHPGGAVWTDERTRPGFRHDAGAGFFPFGASSPALAALDLGGAGLAWRHARRDSAHPAPDGSCPAIGRDADLSAASLGADGDAWRRLAAWQERMGAHLPRALLAPVGALGPLFGLGPASLARLARIALSSPAGFASRTFSTEAARRVVPGLALHADLAPDDGCGALIGVVLALLASWSGGGFPVAEGGAASITRALVRRLEEAGGTLRCGTRASRVVVRGGRAAAVVAGGVEIEARRAVLADTSAPALALDLVGPDAMPGGLVRAMRRFRAGWGTFKLDWALDGPVPWMAEAARESAVVHVGDSVDDLSAFAVELRAGRPPSRPYLVVGQQSLADPTRAPPGAHTLWAYTHVPSEIAGGWDAARDRLADAIDARIEELAPGFGARVLARVASAPPDLERADENLRGGDIGGGTAAAARQLLFRPAFPWFRHRFGVRGLYLASSYAHPGPGVHGACGANAAAATIRDEE